jgi:hypothetical protein
MLIPPRLTLPQPSTGASLLCSGAACRSGWYADDRRARTIWPKDKTLLIPRESPSMFSRKLGDSLFHFRAIYSPPRVPSTNQLQAIIEQGVNTPDRDAMTYRLTKALNLRGNHGRNAFMTSYLHLDHNFCSGWTGVKGISPKEISRFSLGPSRSSYFGNRAKGSPPCQ